MTRYLLLAFSASLLALPVGAAAQDATQTAYDTGIALPDLTPEEIARDVRTQYNSRTGSPERIAPSFDPFEADPDLAAEASLRSTGPVRDIEGRPMGDGAVLDLSLYYTSEGTRDYGRMRDALYVSGQPVPIIRRDSRELECSSRVTETIYESDRYYGGYASYAGLTRVRPRYYGHSDFGYGYGNGYGGYGYDPYSRGYGNYGYGRGHGGFGPRGGGRPRGVRGPRVVEPGTPAVTNPPPAIRPIGERGTGARINERDILQPSTRTDDGAVSDTRPNSSTRGGRRGRIAGTRPGPRGAGGRPAPRLKTSSRKDPAVPIAEVNDRGSTETPRTSPRTNPRPRVEPRVAPRPQTPTRPRTAPRPSVSTPAPRPRPAPVSKPRPSKPVSKPRPRSAPPSNPHSRRGNRQLELFPNGRGDAVVVSASRDCAREDQLSVFIPAERLDAARFDGLTLIVRDVVSNGATGLTQVYDERPLYIPPNYIEGFRLALDRPELARSDVR